MSVCLLVCQGLLIHVFVNEYASSYLSGSTLKAEGKAEPRKEFMQVE